MKYEYVFSAPSFLRLTPRSIEQNHRVIPAIIECVRKLSKDLDKNDMILSLLFNAFTEKTFGPWQREHSIYGLQRLYADSGGLQIITTGRKITPEAKSMVYEVQKVADFAMCFDEIPIKSLREKVGSDRTQTKDKIYQPSRAKDCAIKTALNIKEQVKYLRQSGSDTKVFYIIQGNNSDDMVEWFRSGIETLDDVDWDTIGGVAIAGTCIGNGMQESVEISCAYHRIRKEFSNHYTKNHVHLLGFGSVRRLLPFIQLGKKGFLSDDIHLSFDSSSFSMAVVMGKYSFDANTEYANAKNISKSPSETCAVEPTPMWLDLIFREIIEYYGDILLSLFPESDIEQIVSHLIETSKSITQMELGLEGDSNLLIRTILPLLGIHQVLLFSEEIQKNLRGNEGINKLNHSDRAAMFGLSMIKDLSDYNKWMENNYKWMCNSSTRIAREYEGAVSLNDFFS